MVQCRPSLRIVYRAWLVNQVLELDVLWCLMMSLCVISSFLYMDVQPTYGKEAEDWSPRLRCAIDEAFQLCTSVAVWCSPTKPDGITKHLPHLHIYIYIHYITLHYIALHCITLHYITLHTYIHYITLLYIILHCFALHYIALHYIGARFQNALV